MFSLCIQCNNTNILKYLKNKLLSGNLSDLTIHENNSKVISSIIVNYNSESLENFYYKFCNIFSNLIIQYYEPILIKRVLALNYFYFNKDDIRIIMDEFALLKEKKSYNRFYVKSLLFSSIYDYIIQNNSLIISGFVDFRLKTYISYLEDIVSEAVNQYIIDKEYISFVNLLKSYIDSKAPNNKMINLVYINSKALLLSEKNEIIELESFDSSYLSDISFSSNDYVLNTLIGLLPKKIRIHLVSPKDQFIKTIEMIFGSRVYYCNDCDLCQTYKTLKLT